MPTKCEPLPDQTVDRHFRHRGFGAEFAMEVDWIRAHLPIDAARIVDVGCGGGALFDAYGETPVVGVDYALEGLAFTAARFPDVPVVCASAECLPFVNECADAVIAQHVIEHLPDYQSACREWYRVLRPGGSLLVLTPNVNFRDATVFEDETHVHLFSVDELAALLGSVGFRVFDLRTLGLDAFRRYQRIPGAWRLRRLVTEWASPLSILPGLGRRGQTLCCCAMRPDKS